MSRDSVPAEDYDSFVADSDRFFDENFDHETDDTHSAEDIVKILQSMDVASDDERDQIKANLMNSLPGGATTESLGESDYEFYGYLLLNAIVFSLFGKQRFLFLCLYCPHSRHRLIDFIGANWIHFEFDQTHLDKQGNAPSMQELVFSLLWTSTPDDFYSFILTLSVSTVCQWQLGASYVWKILFSQKPTFRTSIFNKNEKKNVKSQASAI